MLPKSLQAIIPLSEAARIADRLRPFGSFHDGRLLVIPLPEEIRTRSGLAVSSREINDTPRCWGVVAKLSDDFQQPEHLRIEVGSVIYYGKHGGVKIPLHGADADPYVMLRAPEVFWVLPGDYTQYLEAPEPECGPESAEPSTPAEEARSYTDREIALLAQDFLAEIREKVSKSFLAISYVPNPSADGGWLLGLNTFEQALEHYQAQKASPFPPSCFRLNDGILPTPTDLLYLSVDAPNVYCTKTLGHCPCTLPSNEQA